MNPLSRVILVLALCAAAILWAPAARAAEAQAFAAAEKAYLDADFKNADAYFGDFIQKFPGSGKIAEAVLYQAQARVKLGDYNGALNLLSAHQGQAGNLGDWYLLCQGEALLAKGDYARAEADFSKLINDFPGSPRRLAAVVNAALAHQRLSQWPQVIQLLAQTNGVFQRIAATNHANPEVIRGYLLLSEAYLAQNDAAGAERSLGDLSASPLDPTNNWQRQYLLCRALVAESRFDGALQNATNLLILADATGQRSFQAQSVAFQAGVLERLDRKEEALTNYQKNIAVGVPPAQQRQALLKTTDLLLQMGRTDDAAQGLQSFLVQFPTNDCSDLATLTLGELRLSQFNAAQPTNLTAIVVTNAPGITNFLDQAVGAFQELQRSFPHSPLRGKAQLELGWCYWLAGKTNSSQEAFARAIALLPPSSDQAQAFYKLADVQYRLANYAGAITNYFSLVARYADSPGVRTNLCEPALYQIVRAAQAIDDLANATNALAKLLAWFPDGVYTDRALQLQLDQRHPEMVRAFYSDFAGAATNSPVLPNLQLAIARTYEGQNKWDEAIGQYDTWLATFTNSEAQGRAEYSRARANDKAGHETNAFVQFTNFVARFPTNEYGPLARWWVGDYYYREGDILAAELSYKSIFQNTNWASLPIAYEARLMAGRAASKREGWEQARSYFLSLANDRTCPTNLQAQALIALGDTLLTQGSTDKRADYQEAFKAYDLVCKNYPSNALAASAWGLKAICQLQFVQFSQDFNATSNDFQQVLDSPQADVVARSAAEVGIAVTLEKLADTRPEAERNDLLILAKQHDERVLYDNSFLKAGEIPDAFWTKKAGMEAARLAAERLHNRQNAISIYRRLQQMFPPLQLQLDDKIKALQASG